MKCSHCSDYIKRIQQLETLLTLSDGEAMKLKSKFDTLRVCRDIAEQSNFQAIQDRVKLENEVQYWQQKYYEFQHPKNMEELFFIEMDQVKSL